MGACILDLYGRPRRIPSADWGDAWGATAAPGLVLCPTDDPFGDDDPVTSGGRHARRPSRGVPEAGHWWADAGAGTMPPRCSGRSSARSTENGLRVAADRVEAQRAGMDSVDRMPSDDPPRTTWRNYLGPVILTASTALERDPPVGVDRRGRLRRGHGPIRHPLAPARRDGDILGAPPPGPCRPAPVGLIGHRRPSRPALDPVGSRSRTSRFAGESDCRTTQAGNWWMLNWHVGASGTAG